MCTCISPGPGYAYERKLTCIVTGPGMRTHTVKKKWDFLQNRAIHKRKQIVRTLLNNVHLMESADLQDYINSCDYSTAVLSLWQGLMTVRARRFKIPPNYCINMLATDRIYISRWRIVYIFEQYCYRFVNKSPSLVGLTPFPAAVVVTSVDG